VSPTDSETTVATLSALVRTFVAERAWEPFHTPKNLVMALAIEAAELMEHFQWLTPEESLQVASQPDQRAAVGEEMADVLAYLLSLADALGVDVSTALTEKMRKNAIKYPI